MSDKMRSVNTKFWDDSFIQELNPSEKLLFLYLLTNPLTNILGIYEISIRRISFDTGLNKETISKGLERFEKVQKAFYIDEFVILPNFLKNQKLNANMKIGVSKIFNELPKNLKERLLQNNKTTVSNDSKGFEMVLNSLLKYEIEIEKEIEIESEIEESILFDEFWNLYNKKVGNKKACKKKWDKLTYDKQKTIIQTLPEWLTQFSEKQFQPHPETYLNNERWNDEIIKPKKQVNNNFSQGFI